MQIKVNYTKQHNILSGTSNIKGVLDRIVAEGKLVLIELSHGNTPNKKGEICKFSYGLNIAGQDDMGYPVIKLIIISETEKIEVGDWYLTFNPYNGEIIGDLRKCEDINYNFTNCRKVLALPEHFSPVQLQMIVDGKLKDRDKVLVECEMWNTAPMGSNYDEIFHIIKLNSSNHITIIEELTDNKVYTSEEVINILAKRQYQETQYNVKLGECVKDSKEWFNENIK